ncbi:MAG: hypothetical protein NC907_02680, partial [Candidatus Omnitrophica bacterium]|nr:hypothetical protein [Candidatus Omnitrophota bacterium]
MKVKEIIFSVFCMISAICFAAGENNIEKILGSKADDWTISGAKYSFSTEKGSPVLIAEKDGFATITGKNPYLLPAEYTFCFYLNPEKPRSSSFSVSVGCAELSDKTKQSFNASVSASPELKYISYSFNVQPETGKAQRGNLYFHSFSDINLGWPEEIRKNVEWEIASFPKINETLHTLRLVINKKFFSFYLDGRFIGQFRLNKSIEEKGTVKISMYYGAKLVNMVVKKTVEFDEKFFPLELTGFVNSLEIIKGKGLAKGQLENLKRLLSKSKVPFVLPDVNEKKDHIDLGASWMKFGAIKGYIAANFGTFGGRWVSANRIEKSRFCFYVPYARYKALHIIGTYDGEKYNVPVITAQFYRPNAGHPVNFSGKIPVYSAKSGAENVYPVNLENGQTINLFHAVIPIDPGQMDWFSDLDRVGLELTKQVQPYRAYPDPLEYSWHGAGLPSGVHIYAATLEAVETDIEINPEALGHVWTS